MKTKTATTNFFGKQPSIVFTGYSVHNTEQEIRTMAEIELLRELPGVRIKGKIKVRTVDSDE
jgi:hypothetical protein